MPSSRTADEIVRLYKSGKSPSEIEREVGKKRQYVSQVLRAAGYDPRGERKVRAREDAERRFLKLTEGRVAAVLEAFGRTRNAKSAADLLASPKTDSEDRLTAKDVDRVLDESVPDWQVFKRDARAKRRLYDNREMLDCLAECHALGADQTSPLTTTKYDRWQKKGKETRPTRLSIEHRFGSWRQACRAAGLPRNASGFNERVYTDEESLEALAECWRHLGRPPTFDDQCKWDRDVRRKGGAPSAGQIKVRFGTWSAARERAYAQVHGALPDFIRSYPVEGDSGTRSENSRSLGVADSYTDSPAEDPPLAVILDALGGDLDGKTLATYRREQAALR